MKWYKDTFAQKEMEDAAQRGLDVFDILTAEAAVSKPGSDRLFFLPDLNGNAVGASGGVLFGLTLSHRRNEVIRALLEGVTFELRKQFEILEGEGLEAKEVRTIGGAAKSPFWLQLKADITKKKIVRPEVIEGSSLGAAVLAGIGVGAYRDAINGVQHTFREKAVYQNKKVESRLYDRYYQVYKRMRPTFQGLFKDIAVE